MSSFGNGPPTVNSDSQQERILARRERIAERAEPINQPNKPVVSQKRDAVPSISHDICKYDHATVQVSARLRCQHVFGMMPCL